MNVDLDLKTQFNSRSSRNALKPDTRRNANVNASFKGAGALLTAGLQACEQHPMIGVSVIDGATCIVPRAAVDFNTNAHAGLETLRRESSGLLVNCLLPSYFVMGVAGFLNYLSLPKEYRSLGMISSWADENSISKLVSHYKSASANVSEDRKISAYVKSVISDMEGFNSSKGGWIKYSSSKNTLDSATELLSEAINGNLDTKQALKRAYKVLTEETLAAERIRFTADGGEVFGSNLSSMLRDIVDLGKKFKDPAVSKDVDKFASSAIKFVKHKSFAGLAIILPLAASMQYINRWITRKRSGIKGAPIYRDFGSKKTSKKESTSRLLTYKLVGACSMMGLAIASMMKKPNLKMFQFRGLFPTMDQARWIAAITFTSRILAAEDCNEVRESTIRDMTGFASLYFLGDVVAKGVASWMHKVNPKIDLINKNKEVASDAGIFKRFGNWMKNYTLKSFDEVPKELKNHRSVCQATSLLASMLILGLFIPIWNRHQTEKNRAKELEKNSGDVNPFEYGPESTISHIWHKWHPEDKTTSSAFGKFEKMANFK